MKFTVQRLLGAQGSRRLQGLCLTLALGTTSLVCHAQVKNPNLRGTPEFDSNKYYRLTSLFLGKGKSLDVENTAENTVHLAKSEANLEGLMGQYWKIEKDRGGVYYNIKSYFRGFTGQDITLDIVNDSDKNKVRMSETGGFAGQAWKIEKLSNGYYRLTTAFFGEGRSLDVVNDGKERNVQLAPTGDFSGQYWIITEIPTPAKPTTPNPNLPTPPTGAALTVEQQAAQSFRSNAAFDKPINAEKPDYVLINAAVYSVTNEARVQQGKSAVPYHPLLAKAAFDYAREMVTKDFFSHDHPSDPAQRTPSDRGKLAGIKNASLAENIATSFGIQYEAGKSVFDMDATKGVISYTSRQGPAIPMHTYRSLAQSLVDQWMNSPGHRANILSDKSRSLGCGVYFFRDRTFSNVLMVKAVQKFQLFKDVEE